MCSIVINPSGHGEIRALMTIPQFWSRREEWSPGCCIAANLKLGQHSCQLQVYPAGGVGVHMEEQDKMVVSVVNNGEKSEYRSVVEESDEKTEYRSNVEESEDETEYRSIVDVSDDLSREFSSGMFIVISNTSAYDLKIDGLCSLELREGCLESEKCEKLLSKHENLSLFEITTEMLDDLQSRFGFGKDDLHIVLKLSAEVVPLENKECEGAKFEIKEASKGNPMVGNLGDHIMSGLESIQDILLETPLCKEVSELKKDVGQLSAGLTDLVSSKLREHENLIKDTLPEVISKEVAAALKKEMSVVDESNKWAQKQGTYITASLDDILDTMGSMKTSLGAEFSRVSSEAKSLAAISDVKLQLEMLQDSVLTAVSSPPPVFQPVYPECPYCMEDFSPTDHIFQCTSGHLICASCRDKPGIPNCPSCHQVFIGRNRGLEAFLLKLRDG